MNKIRPADAAPPLPANRIESCPGCEGRAARPFFQLPQVPLWCNVLWETPQAAQQAPRAEIALAFCPGCGLIFNAAFEPERLAYDGHYENALHFSPHFQSYARGLAERLVARYALRERDVVEIGCGSGEFLGLLCELGGNRGWGFDPSYDATRHTPPPPGVTIVPELYSPTQAERPVDFLCCRHVLEHLPEPCAFLRSVRQALGTRSAAVYFEVPNALYTLAELGIWDILYEHCSYFTPLSLAHLFETCGFRPLEIRSEYGGQFLGIEALTRPTHATASDATAATAAQDLSRLIDDFAAAATAKLAHWRAVLAERWQAGQRVVVWGAGTKGVMFLNLLSCPARQMPFVVDLNPRKHGHYTAGGGQQIVPPTALVSYQPQTVILMNPNYRKEVAAELRRLECDAEILVA